MIEGAALTGANPYDALVSTLTHSATVRALRFPDLRGFCGIVQLDQHVACPWMVANDRLVESSRTVLRYSLYTVNALCAPYAEVYNWVAAQNIQSIRWLEWLGFTVEPEPVFFCDPLVPFHLFHRSSSLCAS